VAGDLGALAALHDGVPVPEYGAFVPWLIDERELYLLIPRGKFSESVGGWPLPQFTLLGVTAVFGFNFITDPARRFAEVQVYNDDSESMRESFRSSSEALRKQLGVPNSMDMLEFDHLRWEDGRVWVDNSIATGRPGPAADAK
jgi:hypothetical protein